MNFLSSDLKPYNAGSSIARGTVRLPLTPFFFDPASSGNQRTRGFKGSDFYLQYKSNGVFTAPEDTEIFCGTAAYRKSTSVDLDTGAASPLDGSRTRSYLFNTTANSVSVQTIEEGNYVIGNIWPDSATTATQGVPDHVPPDHVEITLSEAADKVWLSTELERWGAESEDFRDAAGNGLSTYSFLGHGATKSESDGYLGIVGGGDVVPFGYTFSGTPSGMVGDEGTLWNGNYSTYVQTVKRKNAPVIHREVSPNYPTFAPNLRAGSSIYKDGYAEIEVSEPLGDVWMDAYGVFQTSTALGGVPMEASYGSSFGNLIYYTDDGEAHELTLVSRTGKRYRVTIETGSTTYDSEGSHWVVGETHVLITDPTTLQATLTFDAPVGGATQVRVSLIEVEVVIDEQTEWETVSDVENGDYPENLIGPSVTGDFLLLAAIKKRSGDRFGFSSLDYSADPTTRYRKRTFRLHLTPGTYNLDADGCGGAVSGAADHEYVDEYDAQTGVQLPRNVTQWSVTINGQDWTPEVSTSFDSVYFSGSAETVKTTTKTRREGSYETTGSFIVAFDAPDDEGEIISAQWGKVAMTFADGINQGQAVALDPPSSGESLFFEGHRLTYGPSSG